MLRAPCGVTDPTSAVEAELKFDAPPRFALPDLADDRAQTTVVDLPALRLRAIYFDTAELTLVRAGVTVRHRTGEVGPVWQVKLPLPGNGALVRREVTFPGPLADLPPPEVVELVTAYARGADVRRAADIRTRRRRWSINGADGTELAEVVDDHVSVYEGRRVVRRFREIEVERQGIDDATFARVGRRLVGAGATAATVTKAARALGPAAVEEADVPTPHDVGKRSRAALLVANALRTGTRRLLAADAGMRLNQPDALHQARVSCRHLRSDLRTFRALVDSDWADPLHTELSWFAGELGAARDLEVLRERLEDRAKAEPALADSVALVDEVLASRYAAALTRATAALRDPRYLALLDRLVGAAQSPVTTPDADAPAAKALRPLVDATWQSLARAARRLAAASPDDDWHRTRIKAKRARYAAETATPVFGKEAQRLAKAAAALQEVLGEHQDAFVAQHALLAIAAERPNDGSLGLAVGRLAERERQAASAARDRFRPTWRRAAEPALRRWRG